MRNKGITLVALVITIIVLLILSGVTISALSGENGIITNAVKAKKMTTLSQCKEEYEMFITEEMIKNNKFQKTSLVAGENNLYFNTQKSGEVGNIFNVIPSLKNNEYSKKLEIIKGDLLLNTKDPKEIELAKSIGIKPNPYDIVNGELLSSDGNLLLMDETGTVTIPDRVTKIGDGAFRGVDGLKTIIIPGTVKEIGDHAFSGNQTLENVIIEEGVEKIGNSTFEDARELRKVKLPNSINEIGTRCFWNCFLLSEINIPTSLKIIKSDTFVYCKSLVEIIIPEGLSKIDSYAFAGCKNLKRINIPESCLYISGTSFSGDESLVDINIHENNKKYCFENGLIMSKTKDIIYLLLSSKTEIKIPSTVTKVSENAFYANKYITNYYIPENVLVIDSSFNANVRRIDVNLNNPNYKSINGNLYDKTGETLIKYCSNEVEVNIPEGVKTIKSGAFYGQNNVKKLILAESVEIAEWDALSGGNKDIYFGKNYKEMNSTIFYSTNNIVSISKENPDFMTLDGTIILSKDGKKLCAVAKDLSNYNIPNTVETIKANSFRNRKNLKQINLPENIKIVEENAFYRH